MIIRHKLKSQVLRMEIDKQVKQEYYYEHTTNYLIPHGHSGCKHICANLWTKLLHADVLFTYCEYMPSFKVMLSFYLS